MSDIKVFVTHTPNRDTMRVDNDLLCNVIAGSDFQKKNVPIGVVLDNQGENISFKNRSYCELTTQYWAWKNIDADYYGFCHYRRFFSFNQKSIKESKWGTIEYDYLNEKAMQELYFNETTMQKYIEKYDFLIAKGITAETMGAKSIYEHYKNAPELYIKDVELLFTIIDEKYPILSECARELFDGNLFYPCNMFIAKKIVFQEYSKILFDILEEFERRANMCNYSREGYRTTGHLGERLCGIYYLYLQKQNKYKLGELQIALIHHADMETKIIYNKEAVPVVLAANQHYVPILYTCIQSIVENISAERQYEIYIFHTDINMDSQKQFKTNIERGNLNITFINVDKKISGYRLEAKQHITTETFYRFLILDILKDYKKVVYLDSDMIICHDVAELYDVDLGDNLIAATLDADFAGQCNIKTSDMYQYAKKIIGLENPFQYFQAGVLVFHVAELNKTITVQKLLEMSETGIYRFSDQDILNVVCKNRVIYLDMAWNMIFDCDHFRWHNVIKYAPYYILDAYEEARKEPCIIHYAGFMKPWMHPDEDFATAFWSIARRTIYYEQLISRMQNDYAWHISKDMCKSRRFCNSDDHIKISKRLINKLRNILVVNLPKNSIIRRFAKKIYWKLVS